jgi:hypothetical protein
MDSPPGSSRPSEWERRQREKVDSQAQIAAAIAGIGLALLIVIFVGNGIGKFHPERGDRCVAGTASGCDEWITPDLHDRSSSTFGWAITGGIFAGIGAGWIVYHAALHVMGDTPFF